MTLAMCCGMTVAMGQNYQVPVSEQHEKMQTYMAVVGDTPDA